MSDASWVKVDGKLYRVSGVVESGSRGREYQLSPPDSNLVHRVCFAIEAGAIRFASGSRLQGFKDRPEK
jgi:hypothetical protein